MTLRQLPDGRWAEPMPTACPACHAAWGPDRVLVGWRPCRCGGHRTVACRGCGAVQHTPPLEAGCAEVVPAAPGT